MRPRVEQQRITRRGFIQLAAGLLTTSACAKKPTIQLGVPYPMTGPYAGDGTDIIAGVTLAVDEINALGGLVGHKLKYIEVDDKDSTGDQVTTAFQRAIEVEKQ